MSLSRFDAAAIARDYVKSMETDAGYELLLLDDLTMETNFGWVFFYNSKKYIETDDDEYALLGNAPIVVSRTDGSVHVTGTALPVEEYLRLLKLE